MDADITKALPRRAPGVVSRELGDEFVVLDPDAGTAHRLHGTVAQLWRTLAEPALVDLESGEAVGALAELDVLGLVAVTVPEDAVNTVAESHLGDLPRRRRSVLRAGAVAATAAAVSGIETIVLPTAAHAASNNLSFSANTAGTYTQIVLGSISTLHFTLNGAGGGGGGSAASGNFGGGIGGDGASLDGTIDIDRGSIHGDVTVTIVLGQGGASGGNGGKGGSGFGTGGDGYKNGGGGGGGGGSAILLNGVPYLVAGAGGGGGRNAFGAASTNVGGDGGDAGLVNVNGASTGKNGRAGQGGGATGDQALGGRGGRTDRISLGLGATGGAGGGAVGRSSCPRSMMAGRAASRLVAMKERMRSSVSVVIRPPLRRRLVSLPSLTALRPKVDSASPACRQ